MQQHNSKNGRLQSFDLANYETNINGINIDSFDYSSSRLVNKINNSNKFNNQLIH